MRPVWKQLPRVAQDADKATMQVHALLCATRTLDAVTPCDLCGCDFANSGAMKSHRRFCTREAATPPAVKKRRVRSAAEPLLDWEKEKMLPPAAVDEKLWAGASEAGWRVVPKYRGAEARSHWSYVSPEGARLTSKPSALAAAPDGGAVAVSQTAMDVVKEASGSDAALTAIREAERLGLQLVRSSRSNTGFKCVAYNACYAKRPFKVQVTEGRRQLRLGDFPTAEEAALCYAKHLGAEKAAAAAALAQLEDNAEAKHLVALAQPPPPSEDEVQEMAADEGLVLLRARTRSGYKGVRRLAGSSDRPFRAKASRGAAKRHGHLGDFSTAAEAALCYARHHREVMGEAAGALNLLKQTSGASASALLGGGGAARTAGVGDAWRIAGGEEEDDDSESEEEEEEAAPAAAAQSRSRAAGAPPGPPGGSAVPEGWGAPADSMSLMYAAMGLPHAGPSHAAPAPFAAMPSESTVASGGLASREGRAGYGYGADLASIAALPHVPAVPLGSLAGAVQRPSRVLTVVTLHRGLCVGSAGAGFREGASPSLSCNASPLYLSQPQHSCASNASSDASAADSRAAAPTARGRPGPKAYPRIYPRMRKRKSSDEFSTASSFDSGSERASAGQLSERGASLGDLNAAGSTMATLHLSSAPSFRATDSLEKGVEEMSEGWRGPAAPRAAPAPVVQSEGVEEMSEGWCRPAPRGAPAPARYSVNL